MTSPRPLVNQQFGANSPVEIVTKIQSFSCQLVFSCRIMLLI